MAAPTKKASGDARQKLARTLTRAANATFVLRLYVAGSSPQSLRAIANVKKLCEQNLKGRYELSIVDLHQQPQLAEGEQVIATPTLLKTLPKPPCRVIGDMSDSTRLLAALGLRRKRAAEGAT